MKYMPYTNNKHNGQYSFNFQYTWLKENLKHQFIFVYLNLAKIDFLIKCEKNFNI